MHASTVQIRTAGDTSGLGREQRDWGVAVERGPDWLFLRLESPPGMPANAGCERLADRIVAMILENHAHRVVLELDHVNVIDDDLIGMIADVGARVRGHGGLIRVCGLSQPNLSKLRSSSDAGSLAHFDSRLAAVGGRGRPVE
jgi:MFS superfamily sulfate permease-like transporter